MYLPKCSAHERTCLRRNQHPCTVEQSTAHDHAVMKLFRKIEQRQVRTGLALLGADEFLETPGIEQASHAIARGRLVPTRLRPPRCIRNRLVDGRRAHERSPSIARTACAKRKDTMSGRAPPSLMERFRPPGERRSTKSATTICQTSSNPSAAVLMSTSHSPSGSTRSTSTSRFPEATTPTIASGPVPDARCLAA